MNENEAGIGPYLKNAKEPNKVNRMGKHILNIQIFIE